MTARWRSYILGLAWGEVQISPPLCRRVPQTEDSLWGVAGSVYSIFEKSNQKKNFTWKQTAVLIENAGGLRNTCAWNYYGVTDTVSKSCGHENRLCFKTLKPTDFHDICFLKSNLRFLTMLRKPAESRNKMQRNNSV